MSLPNVGSMEISSRTPDLSLLMDIRRTSKGEKVGKLISANKRSKLSQLLLTIDLANVDTEALLVEIERIGLQKTHSEFVAKAIMTLQKLEVFKRQVLHEGKELDETAILESQDDDSLEFCRELNTSFVILKKELIPFKLTASEVEERQVILLVLQFHEALINTALTIFRNFFSSSRPFTGSISSELSHLLKEILANSFETLSMMANSNLEVCSELSLKLTELLEVMQSNLRLVSLLLSEIYSNVDLEVRNEKRFFEIWIDQLETVTEDNMLRQTHLIKILRNSCIVGSKPKKEYQQIIASRLFFAESPICLVRYSIVEDKPWVTFETKGESEGDFMEKHPKLKSMQKLEGSLTFSLATVGELNEYSEYLRQVMILHSCLSTLDYKEGFDFVTEKLGFTHQYMKLALNSDKLCAGLKSAVVYLVNNKVLNQSSIFMYKFRNLSFTPQSISDTEAPKPQQQLGFLYKWLDKFWMKDLSIINEIETFRVNAVLILIKSGVKITISVVESGFLSLEFMEKLSIVLPDTLLGLVDNSEIHAGKHWITQMIHKAKSTMTSVDDSNKIVELADALVDLISRIQKFKLRFSVLELLRVFNSVNDQRSQLTHSIRRRESVRTFKNTLNQIHPISSEETYSYTPTEQEKSLKFVITTLMYSSFALSSEVYETSIRLMRLLEDHERSMLSLLKLTDFIVQPHILDINAEITVFTDYLMADIYWQRDLREKDSFSTPRPSVIKLAEQLRYLLNSLKFLKRDTYAFVKTQNLLRHQSVHISVMKMWTIAARLYKQEGPTREIAEVLSLCVAFVHFFISDNDINKRSAFPKVDLVTFSLGIPKLAYVVQQLTDFEHVERIRMEDTVCNLLSLLFSQDQETAFTMEWLCAMMISSKCVPNKPVQNLVGCYAIKTFLTENHSGNLGALKNLMLILALAAEDNTVIVYQVRDSISPETLLQLYSQLYTRPDLARAALQLYVAAYLSKVGNLNIQQPDTATILQFFNPAIDFVEQLLSSQQYDLIRLGHSGKYEEVFPEIDHTVVCLVWTAQEGFNLELEGWRFISEGESPCYSTGIAGALETLTELIDQYPSLQSPELLQLRDRFNITMLAVHDRVKRLSIENPILNFTNLLQALKTWSPHNAVARPIYYGEQITIDKQLGSFIEDFAHYIETHNPKSFLAKVAESSNQSDLFKPAYEAKCSSSNLSLIIRSLNKFVVKIKSPKYKAYYFDFFRELIPKDKPILKNFVKIFWGSGIIEQAMISTLEKRNIKESLSAIQFLVELLGREDLELQDAFLKFIIEKSYATSLFILLKKELASFYEVLAKAAHDSSSGKGISNFLRSSVNIFGSSPDSTTDYSQMASLIFSANVLKLVQVISDNCNLNFQNFLREQVVDGERLEKQTNVIVEVVNFLIKISQINQICTFPWIRVLENCLLVIAQFVTGPCPDNQLLLGTNVQLIITVQTIILNNYRRFEAVNPQSKIEAVDPQSKIEAVDPQSKTYIVSCINLSVSFLLTLLEGNPQKAVVKMLFNFLDLRSFIDVVKFVWEKLIANRENMLLQHMGTPSFSSTDENLIISAAKIVILLIQLGDEDPSNTEITDFFSLRLGQSEMQMKIQTILRKISPAVESNKECFGFFATMIGYVELKREQIEGHYYIIPYKCKFITDKSKEEVCIKINRESISETIEDFLVASKVCKKEMEHQQLISRSLFKMVTMHWALYWKLCFFVTLITNILMLEYVENQSDLSLAGKGSWDTFVLVIPGVLLFLLATLAHFCFLYEYYPSIVMKKISRQKSMEMLQFSVVKHNDSLKMHRLYDTYDERAIVQYERMKMQNFLFVLLTDNDTLYYIGFSLTTFAAIAKPFLYSLLLLDIIKRSTNLTSILQAITMSYWQLISTLILGLISIFIFSSIAFSSYDSYKFYTNDGDTQAVTYCGDLWNCFFSTLNIGVRSGGGIGDGIRSPLLDEAYGSRVLFDLLFFIVVIIILINIIFGIILDNFSQLRDKRQDNERSMNTKCYICDIERNQLQLHGRGWSFHFMFEHSPFAYLSFLVYIEDKTLSQCSGIEFYVKKCLETGSTKFFPNTSRYLDMKANKL